MKRSISKVLVAFCAAAGLAACEAAPVTPAAAGTTDTGLTGSDAGVGSGDAAVDTAKDTSSTTGDTTAPAGCNPKCAAGETCDTATKKCVAPPKPCDGKCTASQYCDLAAKACKDVTCKFPDKWATDVQKVSVLGITPESGLVAGTTCKEDKDCDAKLGQKCDTGKSQCKELLGCDLNDDGKNDNKLSKILSLYKEANNLIGEKVADGTVVILFEPSKYVTDGTAFPMNMLIGDLDKVANVKCDTVSATANCKYTVSKASYDFKQTAATCPAQVVFDNTKVTKGKMTAGGDKQVFALTLSFAGIELVLKISKAQLFGAPTTDTAWETTKKGQICGVLTKDDLNAAIDAVPDEALAAIGDKETVKGLVASVLAPDIDLHGTGKKDAISVSLDFETVKGTITGMTPDKN